MQPTSKFGELFQYSNPLAAAAGFIGGHVAFPKLELGKAYDQAMQTRVFDPLGMKSTTFDGARAKKKNEPEAFEIFRACRGNDPVLASLYEAWSSR